MLGLCHDEIAVVADGLLEAAGPSVFPPRRGVFDTW